MRRHYSLLDRVLAEVDHALRCSLANPGPAKRPSPAEAEPEASLDEEQQQLTEGLMRVNHSGEIAAQALYRGQALLAQDEQQRQALLDAANEEQDHLAWCQQRLDELGGNSSQFALFWYAGSFAIGVAAAAAGDRWSLGFVEETEEQVSAHLDSHLERLPAADRRSHAILQQMRHDEAEHAEAARQAGAEPLPEGVKKVMSKVADIMKTVSFRF